MDEEIARYEQGWYEKGPYVARGHLTVPRNLLPVILNLSKLERSFSPSLTVRETSGLDAPLDLESRSGVVSVTIRRALCAPTTTILQIYHSMKSQKYSNIAQVQYCTAVHDISLVQLKGHYTYDFSTESDRE